MDLLFGHRFNQLNASGRMPDAIAREQAPVPHDLLLLEQLDWSVR